MNRPAGVRRRLACLVYEALLLAGVWLVASFPVAALFRGMGDPWVRHGFQLYLLAVAGGYFVWFWRHGGQTLAMKTWRIRLVDARGGRIGLGQAWLRYVLAVLGMACGGLGYFWAMLDRDRQYLHDRLAGTRLVEQGVGGE